MAWGKRKRVFFFFSLPPVNWKMSLTNLGLSVSTIKEYLTTSVLLRVFCKRVLIRNISGI